MKVTYCYNRIQVGLGLLLFLERMKEVKRKVKKLKIQGKDKGITRRGEFEVRKFWYVI